MNNKKVKYLKKSLCFNCNENGYIINNCPKEKKIRLYCPKKKFEKKFNDFNLFLSFFFSDFSNSKNK